MQKYSAEMSDLNTIYLALTFRYQPSLPGEPETQVVQSLRRPLLAAT